MTQPTRESIEQARAEVRLRRVLALMFEVFDGRRPMQQLEGFLSDEVQAYVQHIIDARRSKLAVPQLLELAIHPRYKSPISDFNGTYSRGERVRAFLGTVTTNATTKKTRIHTFYVI